MPLPLWRLAVVAGLGAVVILAVPGHPVAAILAVNAVVAVVAAVDGLRTTAPARLGLERRLPEVVRLGEQAVVNWALSNPTRRRLRVSLADELPPSLRPDDRRAHVTVPEKGVAQVEAVLRPARRGRFTTDGVTVRVEGPWRLVARQARRRLPGVVRVYPPFDARRAADLKRDAAQLEVGVRTTLARGAGTEFDQLREYRVDDEFRRIDWAATARAGKPIVRSYRTERNQTVLLLLDSGRLMAGQVGGVPRLDHALDAVLLLSALAIRVGDRAGLIAFADDVGAVVPASHRRDQLARVTEACYDLQPRLVESDYRQAFATTLARFRRRALLVVLTDLAGQAVAETLLPTLPLVARSHLVLVAAVRDPAVDEWSKRPPGDASAAYRAAAAVQALDDRRRVAARLRGLGVLVVDEVPQRLAPALAATYLDVKRARRL